MPNPAERLATVLSDRYRVERELGQGGMAMVYLAHDLRHHRKVALKVLRPELAAVIGAERFLQEITTTANLQHPHILGLYDSGQVEGTVFYVMPFVDGESLRDRLTRERQLAVDEAVRITREVASALDYAHRHGVIHRDIKPENILLHDGSALVADFGIALAASRTGGSRMTETGMSLGTPHYMSPEQAMGERELTARSDVYALGCVLYEMLAGEPPFTGPTPQAIVARVVTEEPRSLSLQRKTIPPQVEAATLTALAKLPADRFASAAQFAEALGNPSFTLSRTTAVTAAPGRSWRAGWPTILGAAALLLAGVGVGAWLERAPAPPRSVAVRYAIVADSGQSLGFSAISPDGSTLVYRVDGPGAGRFYVRRLTELEGRPLPGTENAGSPFFSPDGAWIGFASGTELRKLRLDGSTPVTVAGFQGFFAGGAWGSDGTIVFSLWTHNHLYRVSANGGTPEPVAMRDSVGAIFLPEILPGRKEILCSVFPSGGSVVQLAVLDPASGRLRLLGPGLSPRLIGPDAFVYATPAGVLLRQGFDPATMDTVGPPAEIGSNVYIGSSVFAALSASAAGVAVYASGSSSPLSEMEEVDRTGQGKALLTGDRLWAPRFSPDGRRIAYGAIAPEQTEDDIWIYDVAAGTSQRLTLEGSDSNDPLWSPDGKRILFSSTRSVAGKDLFVQATHQNAATLAVERLGAQWPSDWSRDGRTIVFTEFTGSPTGWDIWTSTPEGAEAKPFLATRFQEAGGRLSPDGKWIAYTSNETGRDEVYVQSFPGGGHRAVISLGGGRDPVWGPSGRELFYWQPPQLVVAALTVGTAVEVTSRRALFSKSYELGVHPNYDVSPDGRRFVIVKADPGARQLIVSLNPAAP